MTRLASAFAGRVNQQLRHPFADQRHHPRHALRLTINYQHSRCKIALHRVPVGEQILPDDTYLELVSDILHAPRVGLPTLPSHDAQNKHPWANKVNSWLSYAFLGVPYATPPLFTIVNACWKRRAATHAMNPMNRVAKHDQTVSRLKWEVSTPAN